MIETPICPMCGCSLVRLGIKKEDAVPHTYAGKDYFFCCSGCLKRFMTDPEKHLADTDGQIVCPACLAERRPPHLTKKLEHEGETVYSCGCPHCEQAFKKHPQYYLDRLSGKVEYPGVLGTVT